MLLLLNFRFFGWVFCFSEFDFYFLFFFDFMSRVSCLLSMFYILCGKYFLEERTENRIRGGLWLNMAIFV